MLEVRPSASGHNVSVWQGRATASLRDPVAEAQKWCAHIADRVSDQKTCFVLGVGSAWHIFQLRAAHPDIRLIAIETNKNVAQQEHIQELLKKSNCELVIIENETELFQSQTVRQALTNSYTVVSFFPAVHWNAKLFKNIQLQLCGRDPEGFRALWKLRWNKDVESDLKPALFALPSNECMSLRHALQAMRTTPEISHDDRLIFLALSELIK